jgi:pyruvate, water dikinase
VLRFLLLLAIGCGESTPCEMGAEPSRQRLACEAEFLAQAARPLDSALPGARTIKTIVDRADGDRVHYLDTTAYPLHRSFAVDHLAYPPDGPFVNEYLLPGRRFLLGSVTHYEEPDVWAYELAPYDGADAAMIELAFRKLAGSAYFGGDLVFHPTSQEQLAVAETLPDDIGMVTTEEIWQGLTYQPLNLGETYAQVRRLTVAELATTYVSPREIAVLDRVPNDISVVAAVVTEEFQTPLSHVNVLSQQRGTPNMALHGAAQAFAVFDGRWVRLTVGAFDHEVVEVTQAEADAWWEAHRPAPIATPQPDYGVTGLIDVDDLGVADVPAVGGKAGNFGELRDIGGDVVVPDGFAIPVSAYRQFLEQHGFDVELAEMIADPPFRGDGNVRRQRLAELQARMLAAPVDAALLADLNARLAAEFPGQRMRFRSSTTAEDLEGWTGAGLYESESGDPSDPSHPIDRALRIVWSSLWSFRAFEEREYAGIVHLEVAMAVLVHPAYVSELANGVAITANVFDPAPGGEDAFYVNAQLGEVSVVQPDPGVVCDQLMYYHFHNGQPATYYQHSSLAPGGTTVLSRSELYRLGLALDAIRDHFAGIYDPPAGYGRLPMDVEWKLVDAGDGTRRVEIKQARHYPGRGR